MTETPLVALHDVQRHFPGPGGVVRAVNGVSLTIGRGQTVGVVGESGSGKSTLGRIIVGLDDPTAGRVVMAGHDLAAMPARARRTLRRDVQMVFQDPYSSLNPRMTVGRQVGESLLVQGGLTRAQIAERVAGLFDQVGLRPAQMASYPHEFSGGQRQRIAIARAVAPRPHLIVADEPVSALDVSVQAQILNLLVDIQRKSALSYLFIAHDIAVVAHVSHVILVMHRGVVVEYGQTHEVMGDAQHPYSQALLAAVPRFGRRRRGGAVPEPRVAAPRERFEWCVRSPTHAYRVEI
ncbi:MAG: ABC transporter ATP-binding protein [Azospirillaceae bacterium]|nr:ABC transporter ATP-binding protein [Azospirillaceae bacterium]